MLMSCVECIRGYEASKVLGWLFSFRDCPEFLAAPLSRRCGVLDVNSPGCARGPHNSPAERACVRILLCCVADDTVLDIQLISAAVAMVYLPSLYFAGNIAVAERAVVDKLFGSDVAIFNVKYLTTRFSMIYCARVHTATDCNVTIRTNILVLLCCRLHHMASGLVFSACTFLLACPLPCTLRTGSRVLFCWRHHF